MAANISSQYGIRHVEVKQEQLATDAWTENEHDQEVGDSPVGQIQIDVVQEVGKRSQQRVREKVGQRNMARILVCNWSKPTRN